MAKKMSHLALLFGGVLLFILFFVMVTGKKEGFRPPGPACDPAEMTGSGFNSHSECTSLCKMTALSGGCNRGYYNATTGKCECFVSQ